jgi:nucleotide-binding universal stress UspA family protein
MKTVERGTRLVLKTILFATDFSPVANAALCYAADLASRFGAKLVAVHAKGMPNYALPPETWHQEDQVCQEEMERLRELLTSSFPEVEADFRTGEGLAWQVLAAIAAESKADLIVTASSGRVGVDRLLLGSQAEEIIRHAPCPVLTAGPQVPARVTTPWKLSDILYATNFGPESRAAVGYAISLAEEHQARLTLLHVAEPPKPGDLVYAGTLVTSLKNLLHEMVPEEAMAWCEPRFIVENGRPGEKILQVAQGVRAGLIILGARRPEGLPGAAIHLPVGVVHEVIANAACPVLTVGG